MFAAPLNGPGPKRGHGTGKTSPPPRTARSTPIQLRSPTSKRHRDAQSFARLINDARPNSKTSARNGRGNANFETDPARPPAAAAAGLLVRRPGVFCSALQESELEPPSNGPLPSPPRAGSKNSRRQSAQGVPAGAGARKGPRPRTPRAALWKLPIKKNGLGPRQQGVCPAFFPTRPPIRRAKWGGRLATHPESR